MSEPVSHPDGRGRLSALLLLWSFARPSRGWIALTFGGALLATLAQLAAPLVTAAVVDGPLARHDRRGLIRCSPSPWSSASPRGRCSSCAGRR